MIHTVTQFYRILVNIYYFLKSWPNPTHGKLKKISTQADPWVDPIHRQLWNTVSFIDAAVNWPSSGSRWYRWRCRCRRQVRTSTSNSCRDSDTQRHRSTQEWRTDPRMDRTPSRTDLFKDDSLWIINPPTFKMLCPLTHYLRQASRRL